MAYRYALCGELPRPARARTGVYWIHESAELNRSATRRGREGSTLSELARPWLRPKVLAVYDRKDAKPFVSGLGRRLPGRLGEKSALAIPARPSADDQPDDVTG
jgi:hypothetical protein